MWRWLKGLFYFFFLLGSIGMALVLVAYYHYSKDLPKLGTIEDYQPPVMAEVFDDKGKKIGEFWKESRLLTPIEQIPEKLIQAFVASEDDRFFEHGGVDVYGLARAFYKNLQAGRVRQGGSTITQQLVKSILLTPERSYERKIKEAILATRIEKNFSKEQILYLYLNQIYFGNRAHGIEAAARNYFHKKLSELNLAEIAIIAGLPKNPNQYNPIKNPQKAKARMGYVLEQMLEEGYLNEEEAKQAKTLPIKAYKAVTDKEFNLGHAPYFVEEVRRQLIKKYGSEALYTQGWKIHTTLNLDMYEAAQQSVIQGLEKFSKKGGYRGPIKKLKSQEERENFLKKQHISLLQGKSAPDYYNDPKLEKFLKEKPSLKTSIVYQALVLGQDSKNQIKIKVANHLGMIPAKSWAWAKKAGYQAKTGDVIEVFFEKNLEDGQKLFRFYQSPQVESALYALEPDTGAVKAIIGGSSYGKSEFNRATQALLQPGSTIKPLVYAAGLDKGYTPKTTILDAPLFYETGKGRYWKPKNAGGKHYGPTAFGDALRFSRNVPTVKILLDIGTHFATAYMRKLGLSTPITKVPAMALGANEVYLSEMVQAYGSFANGGLQLKAHLVNKIINPKGKIIEEFQSNSAPKIVQYGSKKAPKLEQAKSHQDWQSMDYQDSLFQAGQEAIKKDDLQLNDYEQKMLYGSYIPDGYLISPKTATTMVNLLQGVVTSGTGRRALALKRQAAGKTGTTNKATDVWFIGFTPNLVAGAWVGHDAGKKSLGRGIEGGNTALPIWLEFMKAAVNKYEKRDFSLPADLKLAAYAPPVGQIKEFDPDMLKNLDAWGEEGGSTEFFFDDLGME